MYYVVRSCVSVETLSPLSYGYETSLVRIVSHLRSSDWWILSVEGDRSIEAAAVSNVTKPLRKMFSVLKKIGKDT